MKDLANSNNENSNSKSDSSLVLNVIIVVLSLLILFLGYSLISQLSTVFDKEITTEQVQISNQQIQIEVLNGCGVAGVADSLTEFLRNKGFDVVNKGNYSSFNVDETLLIDRSDNLPKVKILADILGVKKNNVIKQINDQYFLDISLIVGKDYKTILNN